MPQAVRIITEAPQPIVLPVGVVFVDLRVEADIDGQPRDVTEDSRITIEGDPASAAIALRDNAIVGIKPGEATLKAEFAGQAAEKSLTFQVVEKLELDGIVVEPPSLTLSVNENTRLDAIGMLNGRPIGLVTDHPEITWTSSDPDVVKAEGPLLTALSQGTAGVTAGYQNLTSEPAAIRVLGEEDGVPADVLTLNPSAITLRPGESVEIGGGVSVLRGDADLSRQAVVAPANADIVTYDEATRRLTAGLPGKTRVTVAVGEQTANLDVTVLTDAPNPVGGVVVIEPVSGVIAVGEQLPVQVYLHAKDGQRYNVTDSALLGSSDPKVAGISGTAVQGVSPGRVSITAQVRGAETPANATFDVQNLEFTHLEVNPYRFDLTLGQKLWYEIYAVGPAGRRRLGDDPELKITHERLDGSVEPLGFPHMIEGKWPTNAQTETVKIRWKELARDVAYTVRDERISGLVIRPADASIEVGETLDYQVFVRRGGRLDPLSNLDGVELSVGNTVIASRISALRVRGESEGTTEVIAEYAGQQARARLLVRPRTRPLAPSGRPVALRIRPDTFEMEIDTSSAPIRVVRLYSDGSTEDVAHLAELTADPVDIVEITKTASGPMIRPNKIGQTQIHAKVGDLETETPMLVAVTEDRPGRPRLVAAPREVRVNVGDAKSLNSVALIPAQGGSSMEVPFKITATPNDFFTVENDRRIRGVKPGQAIASVILDDPDNKSAPEPATVIVVVSDPAESRILTNESQLELRGPTSTTQGAEVAFRVDMVDGSAGQDVTNDATLVLGAGEEDFAEVQPGGRLIAKKPGLVNVQARYNTKYSNSIPLRINPPARSFQRLELALNADPIGVGESRPYRVWGYPDGGGPRQDLTQLIDQDPAIHPRMLITVLEPDSTAKVVDHKSPNIVGQTPGKISVQAAIGTQLLSNQEEVTIVKLDANAKIDELRVEPGSITLNLGETTPALKVLVKYQGGGQFVQLKEGSANIFSQTETILAPSENSPGRFTAQEPGTTRINVEYEGQKAWANVTVVSNRFKDVRLGKFDVGFDKFKVPIVVTTDPIVNKLEFRLLTDGTPPIPQGEWRASTPQNDNTQTVTLETDYLRLAGSSKFRFIIESRIIDPDPEKANESMQSYPYMFSIEGK
jgi:hypothetical protein